MDAAYFTFPDGALTYDCAACGQRCCRGKGFAVAEPELVPLLARAPALGVTLGAALSVRPGGALGATNVSDGCWFLDDDGFCRVERSAGRALKPVTCRLFPFNRVLRAGGVRVVDVNSFLCPVEPAAGGSGVRHADLAAEIAEITERGGSPLLDVESPAPAELPADWATREGEILARAFAATGDADAFAEAMGDGASRARARRWTALYGLDATELARAEAAVTSPLSLVAGSLRWNAIFAKNAPPYPLTVETLPRRLRALAFLGATLSLGRTAPPSLRALTELWRGQAAVLDVLAAWDAPVTLRAPRFDADVPERLRAPLGVLLATAFRGGKTLGDLVEATARTLPAPERPLAVALAASQRETLLG